VGMCVQNFIKIGAGVWISISPPHTNRRTDKQTYVRPFIYLLAEGPGAARVNLQPAEHLKKCALQLLGFQAPQVQGVRGLGSKLDQNLPWTGGNMRAKFH